MEPFTRLLAVAVPIDGQDIDTDQILPARFMSKPRRDYGRYFFHDLRFDGAGNARPDFILNRSGFTHPRILVCDANFGCGSSREQAVQTLADFGIRCVIAPSLGDIFQTNCLKNGVLPVLLPAHVAADMRRQLLQAPGATLDVDLDGERVKGPDGAVHAFTAEPFGRFCLLAGLDEIDYTATLIDHVLAYEAGRP